MSRDGDSGAAFRALILSLASLAAAIVGAVLAPDVAAQLETLLWLLAIIPAFLLAYYRRWGGVATALAGAMLTLVAVQVGAGLLDRDVEHWGVLVRVLLVFFGTLAAVGTLSEMLHRARSRLDQLELTDPVSTLPNRRHATIIYEREFAAAARGRPLTIALFDVDHLKQFRARHGRAACDDALRTFGRILHQKTRRMNFSARYDEGRFLCLISSGDAEGALVFARRVQSALAETGAGGRGFTVTAGVASYQPGMNDAADLLQAADLALYQAQQQGRSGVCIYQPPRQTAGVQESLKNIRDLLGRASRPEPQPQP